MKVLTILNRVLRASLLKVLLVILVLLGGSLVGFSANTNYTYTGVVCQGGVLTLNTLLDYPSFAIPNGLTNEGTWKSITPTNLVFSSLTSRDAVVTNFLPGLNTVMWTHKTGKTFTFFFNVSSIVAQIPTLQVGSGSSLIFCPPPSKVDFATTPNTFPIANYSYYVNGTLSYVGKGATFTDNSYSVSAPSGVDHAYVVTIDGNGCQASSNVVSISAATLALRIDGNYSACDPNVINTGKKLLVEPIDLSFSYTWTTPTGIISYPAGTIDPSVTITDAGSYSVVASKGGCVTPAASVVISATLLSPPLIQGNQLICGTIGIPSSVSLTTKDPVPVNVRNYWMQDGSQVFTNVSTNPTYSALLPGSYVLTLKEVNNELCYVNSASHVISPIVIDETVTITQNCNTPIINHVYSGTGTPPFTVSFSSPSVSTTTGGVNGTPTSVALTPNITGPTTYTITSIRDNGGCYSDANPLVGRNYPLTYYPTPLSRTILGNNVCFGSTMSIGVESSQNGVTYKLYNQADLTNALDSKLGNGSDLPFDNQPTAVGTYVVRASVPGCATEVNMAPTLQIYASPTVYNMTAPAGALCSSSSVRFGLSGTTLGVRYDLVNINTGLSVDFKIGDGNPIVVGSTNAFAGQSAAAKYKVVATLGSCVVDMTGVYDIYKSPTAYNFTNTSGCASLGISLVSGEAGVQYDLYLNGVYTSESITSNIVNFGVKNGAGVYTIYGTSNGCTTAMSGSATIYDNPIDEDFVITGAQCPSAELAINPSQTTVSYQVMWKDTASGAVTIVDPTISPSLGVGGKLSFGSINTPGTYSIRATSQAGACVTNLTDQLIVNSTPSARVFWADNDSSYCATSPLSGVTIFSTTQKGVEYQLNNSSGPVGSFILGNGTNISWPNVTADVYYITATRPGAGCTNIRVTNNLIVKALNPPTATIIQAVPESKCANLDSTFQFNALLSGVAPFTFNIRQNGNVYRTITTNNSNFSTNVKALSSNAVFTITDLVDNAKCSPELGAGSAIFQIDPMPIVTINSNTGNFNVCNGASIQLMANNTTPTGASYQWSNNAITYATTVTPPLGNPTYTVTVTSNKNCQGQASQQLTVNALPTVTLTAAPSACQNGANVTLFGTPVGVTGAYKGPGVSGATFIPSNANLGSNRLVYVYSDPATLCVDSAITSIVVNPAPQINITGIGGNYCTDRGRVDFQVLPSQNAATNGQISLVGHAPNPFFWADNGNASGYVNITNLSTISTGTYFIRYKYTTPLGCTDSLTVPFTILPNISGTLAIQIVGMPANPCQNDNTDYALQAVLGGVVVTNGVTFSGPGVSAVAPYTFTPSTAGNGTHTIRLDYLDPVNGCRGNTSTIVTIGTNLTMTNLGTLYCQNDNTVLLTGSQSGNSPGGRVELFRVPTLTIADSLGWDPDDNDPSTQIYFDPAVLTPGDYRVVYTYTDANGCSNSRNFPIELVERPDSAFHIRLGIDSTLTQFCVSETKVELLPSAPLGSGFSFSLKDLVGNPHPGVSGTTFNPSVAGVGVYDLTYTVTTTNGGCSADSTIQVTVIALPTWDIDNIKDKANPIITNQYYCDYEANDTIRSSNYLTVEHPKWGWTKNSMGVGILKDTVTGAVNGEAIIQPSVAGYGTYQVWFTDEHPTSGCVNTVVKDVEVVRTYPVTIGGFNIDAEYCSDSPIINLTASFVAPVAPAPGGVGKYFPNAAWLTDNGNGTATIDPSLAAVGPHTVTYTYTVRGTCTTQASQTFTILDAPIKYNVSGGGHDCASSPAGLTVSLSGSQTGITYELYLNGAPMSPARFASGTGGVLVFGDSNPAATDAPLTVRGSYTIMAKSSAGCVVAMNGIADIIHNAPDFTYTVDHVNCKNGNDGEVVFTVSSVAPGYGESTPYMFTIDGINWLNTSIFSNKAAIANMPLQIRDAIGCLSLVKDTAIVEPLALTAGASVSPTVGCNSAPYEGSTTLTITGGTVFSDLGTYPDGYDIKWIDSSNDTIKAFNNKKTISNLNIGTYRYDILDEQGCTFSGTVVVSAQPALNLIIDPNPASHIDNNCSGGFAGQFAVIASGGSGQYQFSLDSVVWLPVVGTATTSYPFTSLSGTVAGKSYTAYVRDYKSPRCAVKAPAVSIFSPAPLSLTATTTEITCHNAANGIITLTAGGGKSGTYEYSIDGLTYQPSNVFTTLPANSYSGVSVRDLVYGNTCPSYIIASITLTNPPAISAVASVTKNVKCFGDSDGEVTVSTPNGGTPPYNYRWFTTASPLDTVGNTQTVKNLPPATYQVEITDGHCSFTSNSVVITEPTAIITSFTDITSAACNVATEGGAATLSINGGTAPYAQLWTNGEKGLTIKNLVPGVYGVMVTDSSLCTASNSVNIGMLAPVAVAEDVTMGKHVDVKCHGAAEGKFTLIGSGGSGAYEFSIDSKVSWTSSSSFANLLAGTYDVFVRDSNHPDCESATALSVTISEPAALGLDTLSTSSATCYGASDGVIAVQGTGGSGLYNYSLDGDTIYSAANSWNNLSAGKHSVWVQDANALTCFYKGMAFVEIDEAEPINFTYIKTNEKCNGAADGSITINVTPTSGTVASVWAYSNDGGATYQSSNTFSLGTGAYALRVQDISASSLCESAIINDTLTAPAAISVIESTVAADHVDVKCFGDSTGAFKVVPVPATASLEYSIDDGKTWVSNPIFSGLPAKTYLVSVRNSAIPYCTKLRERSVTITEPASALAITNPILTNINCHGAATGAINVTVVGGTFPHNFSWRNSLNAPIGAINNIPTSLTADTYSLLVTDAGGCKATDSYTLTEPAAWDVPIVTQTNVTTFGGSDGELEFRIDAGAAGPYTIDWSDGLDQNSTHRTNLVAGAQWFMITTAKSCTYTYNFTLTQPSQLTYTAVPTNAKCYMGNSGVIDVTITSGIPPYTISYTANLTHGGSATGTQNNNTPITSFSSLAAGVYTITVVDGSGQTLSTPNVAVGEALEFNIQPVTIQNISCPSGADGLVQISVGGTRPAVTTSGYDLLWEYPDGTKHPGTVATMSTISVLSQSGSYKVTVFDPDSLGCDQTASFTITKPANWNIPSQVDGNVTVNGGSDGKFSLLSIAGSTPPYQIRWYNSLGVLDASGNDLMSRNNLSAGDQKVVVTSVPTGCKDTIAFNITQPGPLKVSVSKIDTRCYQDSTGEIEVNILEGNPDYTYHIKGNLVHGGTYTPTDIIKPSGTHLYTDLEAGVYDITITDDSLQVYTTQITVGEPLEFTVIKDEAKIKNISCFGKPDGSVGVSIMSAIPPAITDSYNIAWSGPNGFTAGGLFGVERIQSPLSAPGTYVATVTDLKGCSEPAVSIDITEPNDWSVTTTPTNVSTYGGSDGKIDVHSISGNTAPYTIAWADGAFIDFLRTGLVANTTPLFPQYHYTITDFKGCKYDKDVVLTQPAPLVVTVTPRPVTCYGGGDGRIELQITNGNVPYKLIYAGSAWDGTMVADTINPVADNYIIKDLKAGTYIVDITDNVGNVFHPAPITGVTQPNQLLVTPTITDVSCFDETDGMIALKFSGRLPADYNSYIKEWYGPNGFNTISTADTISNLKYEGNYQVTVWDSNKCPLTLTYPLSKPDEIVVTTSSAIKNVTCAGGNDGAISIKVTGRTAGTLYTYAWTRDGVAYGNTPNLTGLTAGNYQVTVTAPDNCTGKSPIFTVAENDSLSESTTTINVTTCATDTSGRFRVMINGGKAPYRLDYGKSDDIKEGSDPFDITGLIAGTYTFTITDALMCPLVVNKTITAPAPLVVSLVVVNTPCASSGKGTLTFNVTGGYEVAGNNRYNISIKSVDGGYALSQVQTIVAGATFNGNYSSLDVGNYTLEVIDINATPSPTKCPIFTTNFVVENITINGTVTNALCADVNSGKILNVDISGESPTATYAWSTTDGLGLDLTTLNQSGLSKGTYKLTVTDPGRGGCVVSRSFVVDEDKHPKIEATVNGLRCYNTVDGSITNVNLIDGAPNVTYHWNGPGINAGNINASSLTGLISGTYTLTATGGDGCSATRSFDVSVPAAIDYQLATTLDNCSPYSRSITMSNLPGAISNYEYSWSGPISGLLTTANLTGLNVGGTYIVTVTDQKLCQVSKSITIAGPMKVVETISHLKCNGATNGAITIPLTGGKGPFIYSWTSDKGFVASTKDIRDLIADRYKLTITDQGETDVTTPANCQFVQTYNLIQPDSIEISATPRDVYCAGLSDGMLTLSVDGGTMPYEYLWSSANGSGLVQGVQDQTGLSGGTYSVTVTDSLGCSKNRNFTITEPQPLSFTLTKRDTDCDGTKGGFVISAQSGGLNPINRTYVWAGPSITAAHQGSTSVSNLGPGIYTVKMSDITAFNKTYKECATIPKMDTLTSAITLSYTSVYETCEGEFNGSIDLTATGGSGSYTYLWTASNGGAVSTPTTQDLGGLPAGTYNVVVTDSKTSRDSCNKSISVVIPRKHRLDVTSRVMNVLCYGDSIGGIDLSVEGGSGDYSYKWSGPAGFSGNTQDISKRPAGKYTVKIIDNVLGCTVVKTDSIMSPLDPLKIKSISKVDVDCNPEASGEITIVAQGGVYTKPYRYFWDGPGALIQNSASQVNLVAGSYKVTVEDDNHCRVISDSIIIDQPQSPLQVNVTNIVDVSAYGGSDGEITVNVVGGANGYNLAWSGMDATNTIVNKPPLVDDIPHQTSLRAGTYNVTVTDGNNCTYDATDIIVRQPGDVLSLRVKTRDVSPCHSDAGGGLFSANVLGGMPPYTIYWYRNSVPQAPIDGIKGAASLTKDSLTVASYRIKVIDNNGIVRDTTVNITEPPLLVVSAIVTANVNCYQASTGSLRINVSGGKPNITNNYRLQILGPNYSVSRTDILPNTNYNFTALAAGNYHIVVTDNSNGDGKFDINTDCSSEQDLVITEPKAEVVISQDSEICKGGSSQIKLITSNWSNITLSPLTVTLSNGTTHTVNSSPFLIDVNPLATTTYTITSVHVSGCAKGVFSGQAVVKVNELPTAYIHNNSEICLGDSAEISVDLTGKAPYSFTYEYGAYVKTVTDISKLPYNFKVAPTETTSYNLRSVGDATCATSLTANVWGTSTITVNSLATATISGNSSICEGDSTNLTIDFNSGIFPWTVKYKVNGVEESHNSNFTPFITSVTPDSTTTYELVSVTDSKGCEQSISGQQVVVTVAKLPAATGIISGNAIVCQNENGVKYTVDSVANATNYNWTVPSGAIIVSGNGTNSILVNFSATTTNGYVSVQSQNSCGTSNSKLLVTVDPLPVAPAIPVGPTASCQGSRGLVYTVTPIIGATGYKWNLPAGYKIVGNPTGNSITVELDSAVSVMTGNLSVQAINSCGFGLPSDNLEVQITPYPTAFAGNDEKLCNTSVTLKATNPGAGFSGQWSILSSSGVIAPGDFGNPAATVTNLMQGENKFVWKVTNTVTDCTVTDTVSIFNNQLIVNASTDLHTTCDGSTTVKGTEFINGPNISGQWSFVPGFGNGTIINGTSPITEVKNLSVGVSRLRWTITKNSCVSSAVVEVVNDKPTTAVIVETFRDVCSPNTTLTANSVAAGESGVWTLPVGSGNIISPNSAITDITNLSRQKNIFIYTITKNSCSSSDTITVQNNILDVYAGDDQATCDGTAIISGEIPPLNATGYWTAKPGNASFSDNTKYSTKVTNLDPNINVLIWSLTKNGCVSSDSIRITNNKPSDAIVGSEIWVCGDTAVLNAVKPDSGTTGKWIPFSSSGYFDDEFDENTVVRGLRKGDNTLRWLVTKGACTDHADLTVRNLKVDVSAGLDSSICERATYLHGSSIPSGATGEWTIADGSATFVSRFVPNARIGGLDYNDNVFVWNIQSNSCISSDSVKIVVNAPIPPNAGVDFSVFSSNANLNATVLTDPEEMGSWELVVGGGDISNPYDPHSTVTNLRRGANVFRWTVEKRNACSAYDEVTITNGQTIKAEAGPDQEVCNGKAILIGNDPDVGIGYWERFHGEGKVVSPSSRITEVVDLGPGRIVFKWTILNATTSTSDTVAIINNQTSVANAGNDRVVCDSVFKLEGNIPTVGNPTWYTISGNGEFVDSHSPNTVVNRLSQGVNVLLYEFSKLGCKSLDTVKITNNTPTTAYAGLDEVLCTDSLELHPNTPTYGIAEWRRLQGSAFFDGNYVKKLAPGPNILEYRITNGATCISSDTIHITNSSASIAHAGNDRNICVDSVTLSANMPQEYTSYGWELIAGDGEFVLNDSVNPNAKVHNLGIGRNRFRWVINNGNCQSVDDVEIANNFIQANAGLSNTICTDTLILEANNPLPGQGSWGLVGGSFSAQFDNPSQPNTVVRNLDQGLNKLTWTILHEGCRSTSQINITNDSPTKAYAGQNRAVCDSFVVLSANKPTTGGGDASWSIVSGGGVFLDSISPFTSVNGLEFGRNLFRWTIVNNSCVSYDDVEVAYNTVFAKVGGNQVLCSDSTSLEASNPSPGVGVWSVIGSSSQASFANINEPNTTVSNLGRGTNILRWLVNNNGCVSYADVSILNDLPSDPYAGNTQSICSDSTILDATEVSIGRGRWTVLTGAGEIQDTSKYNSPVRKLSKGDNVMQWTTYTSNCTLTDEVLIKNDLPSQPYAGSDFESCSNNIMLKAAKPAFGTGIWGIVSAKGNIANINESETEVTNIKPDANIFKWTVVSGNCILVDTIVVTNNTPTTANAGPDIHDCKDNAVLDGNIATVGNGKWSLVTGSAVFKDSTDEKTLVTGLGFGDNSVQWTISKGTCFSSDIVMVFNKVPDQSKAGVDQVVCDNYTTLNANDPTSGAGTWVVMSGLGEFEDRRNYQSKVNNIGFGENVYKWTIQYGSCSTFDLVAIRSNKAYADAGADDVTYTGSYELAANKEDNTPGAWEVLAGQGIFVDANNFNTVVSGLRSGVNTFRWKIIVDNCEAFDDVSVNYKVVPDADFIASTNDGCSPLTVKFTNYTVGRDSTFYWEFDDGVTSTLRHPTHTFQDPGVYTVTLTAKGPDGIDATSQLIITVRPHPEANFSATSELVYIPGDQVRFYNLSIDAVAYKWYFGHDNDMSIERNPIYEYPETGVYSVALMVENIYHCTDSVYKADFITAKQQGFIVFPNAFTPRGGSNVTGGLSSTDKNAIFRPIFQDVGEYQIQIFNQWGQMVYSSNNIDEGWNGEFNGQIVPQGVYVWKVTGKFLSGKGFSDVGNVMVVR